MHLYYTCAPPAHGSGRYHSLEVETRGQGVALPPPIGGGAMAAV
jgi:hypothetical protein